MIARRKRRKARLPPNIAWRAGRPRFSPGPSMRAKGFRPCDLRHANNQWFTAADCWLWHEGRLQTGADPAKPRKPPEPGKASISSREIFALWFAEEAMQPGGFARGKRQEKGRTANTIDDYKRKADQLMAFDPDLVDQPAAILDREICRDLFERLWEAHGLASARSMMVKLSGALEWAILKGKVALATNPCHGLDMPMSQPRLRMQEPADMTSLITAADLLGMPHVGDMITLGLWTAKRQGDRLAMDYDGITGRHHVFRPAKARGAVIISLPLAPQLTTRLNAMLARRKDAKVVVRTVGYDEARGKLYADRFAYGKDFARARAAAVAGIIDEEATAVARAEHSRRRRNAPPPTIWKLAPCPALAGLQDRDLRDVSVTWLARAGCTIPEIASLTGHSLVTVHSILKHYLAAHPDMADSAIAKLVKWYEGQSEAVEGENG